MVTIKMISEKCGLSVAAVSKALNGRPGISPENAQMVKRIAQEMGYVPNVAARALRINRSYNIGLLFRNEMAHEFFSVVLDGIREEAEEKHYDITLLRNSIRENNIGYYENAVQRQCDGVILVQGDFDEKQISRLAKSDMPLVSIDNVYDGHSAVVNDNVGSMEEIVRYLYSMGHHRIAFIHGEIGDVTRQRIKGFYQGMESCGLIVPEGYVLEAKYHEPKYSGLATRELLNYKTPPTCIIYPDDFSYLGGMTELERHGLFVPEDMSCFGYDGIYMSAVLRPQLTTFRQNARKIGKYAVKLLIKNIENPDSFQPEILSVKGEIQPGGTVNIR